MLQVQTRAELFFQLRDRYPNLVGFKEFGGALTLDYAAQHITSSDPELSLMVGVDTQVFHGIVNCGARGVITGIDNVLPQPVLLLMELCRVASCSDVVVRQRAGELDAALQVLSTFDEGPDLVLFYKHLMSLIGCPGYERHFNDYDSLSSSQRSFASAQLAQFQSWWPRWRQLCGEQAPQRSDRAA